MKRILITGATGNVGRQVIRFLSKQPTNYQIVAAVRDIEKAARSLQDYPKIHYALFDFERPTTFASALQHIDSVFLLRPPQLADVDQYFKPLIEELANKHVQKVIFLSVQGVERSKVIPHHKIETLIKATSLDYIFLRPSYFMQNLTTTLYKDIQSDRQIVLPAGEAKFNWVDVENIGETAAILFDRFETYKNKAFDLTGYENKSFSQAVQTINQVLDRPIRYKNMNPFRFFFKKKKEGVATGMIIVLILLHFLPRFQKEPPISTFYEDLTGKQPNDLETFAKREKAVLER